MPKKPDGRDLANRRTERVDELFYNDRLDRGYLSVSDYPARIDQAAIDHFYGISIGKSQYNTGNPLAGSGTVGGFDFGRATGGFYKQGLKAMSTGNSDLPILIEDYDCESVGNLAFRLNELRYKLEQMRTRTTEAQITDITRVLEAVLEKAITRSMHKADENVARQPINDPETVVDMMNQMFSDPSSTAYVDQLLDVIDESSGDGDILAILDSPEMVTPLWEHQHEAIVEWIENDTKGYVNMATATGKTVLGLAAIATLCGRLHPVDENEIDRNAIPQLDQNQRVLIVAGQDLLLEQWRSEFDEHLNIPRDRTGADERLREISLDWGTVEFKTAQELLAADSIRSYDIVVLDEAHQYSRGSQSGRGWRTVLDELVEYSAAILAMSGSIDQGWIGDEAVQNALTDNLPLCKRFSVPEARETGVIADFSWTTVYAEASPSSSQEDLVASTKPLARAYDDTVHKFDIERVDASIADEVSEPFETLTDLRSFSQSKAGSALREKSGSFDKVATAAFSRRPQRWQLAPGPAVIADIVGSHAPEQKTIVLVQSYTQAHDVGSAVREVIGDDLVLVPEAEADNQFDTVQQFNDGDYQVIVGPGNVLGTGVDMPDADVAINVSKGGVNASLIQRIGRVLRNPTGDKRAHFYHLVTLPGQPDALLPGEDGRRLVRRAAEFRALGARLRELPGFTAADDSTTSTVQQLAASGVEALIADRRELDDIVDDEVAQEHLQELIDTETSHETSGSPFFLSEWTHQTLDRETQPVQEAVDASHQRAQGDETEIPSLDSLSKDDTTDGANIEESVTDTDQITSEAFSDNSKENDTEFEVNTEQDINDEEIDTAREVDDNELTDISGVNAPKAKTLRQAGYNTIEDIQRADQTELGDVERIGPALATRMKADVGGINPQEEESQAEYDEAAEERSGTDNAEVAEIVDEGKEKLDETTEQERSGTPGSSNDRGSESDDVTSDSTSLTGQIISTIKGWVTR